MGGPLIHNNNKIYKLDNFNMNYPFTVDGKEYLSAEQYYQANKFADKEYGEYIRKQANRQLIYTLGQSRDFPLSKEYNNNKYKIMYTGMKTRIMTHPELKELLLNTGNDDIHFFRSKGYLMKNIRRQLREGDYSINFDFECGDF